MARHHHIQIWKKAPFIRLLPPLCLGILVGYYGKPDLMITLLLAATVALIVIFLEFLKPDAKFSLRSISGISHMVWVALFGIIIYHYNDVRNDPAWFADHLDEATGISLTVASQPRPAGKGLKVLAEVDAVITRKEATGTAGKVLLYFEKDVRAENLAVGDQLLVRNKIRRIRNSGNPGSFDFVRFMAIQNVYHDAFLRAGDWEQSGKKPDKYFVSTIASALRYSHQAIEKYIPDKREAALAKALLTGDRTQLDRDLVQAYANAGVVHLMAISGLHLGLIYVFLLRFCHVVPGIKSNHWLRLVLVLGGIWFFACMTGMSPSVNRAAVMFSFLALGILKRKKISTLNFWSAAAFIMLCMNPLLLFNVGFQLSFLAVLGILVVQKPIYNWLYFENKMVDYLWQMISVTLAAQLFTLPLCLYYFHQFPVLFVLANLVAIPLASVGLWLGVILLLTASLPAVPAIVGGMVSFSFKLLNNYIQYVDSLGFSVWDGFSLNAVETLILSLFVVLLVHALLNRNKTSFKAAVVCMLLMLGSHAFWRMQRQQQRKIVVYSIPYQTAVDFIHGDRYTHLSFANGRVDLPDIHLHTGRKFLGLTKEDRTMDRYAFGNNEIFVNRKSFLHIKSADLLPPGHPKIRVDVVIISGSPPIAIRDIQQVFEAGMYIFAPSNRRYLVESWKKECEDLLLRSHDIAEEGALVMNF